MPSKSRIALSGAYSLFIECIFIVALGRIRSLSVAHCTGLMETVNGSTDHWPPVLLKEKSQFVCQCRLACCVNAIDGNAKRMGMMESNDPIGKLLEHVLSRHRCLPFSMERIVICRHRAQFIAPLHLVSRLNIQAPSLCPWRRVVWRGPRAQ